MQSLVLGTILSCFALSVLLCHTCQMEDFFSHDTKTDEFDLGGLWASLIPRPSLLGKV